MAEVKKCAAAAEFGGWLKLFADKSSVNGDNNLIFSVAPPKYDAKLPEFKDIQGHAKYTIDDMNGHFANIAKGVMRIEAINDLIFDELFIGKTIKCNGCLDNASSYYHCGTCKNVVCVECCETKKAACAHEMKLVTCRRAVNFADQACDACGCNACDAIGHVWYYDPEMDTHGNYNDTYYSNECRIVCGECVHKPDFDDASLWKPVTVQHANDVANIGSLLDWVPLLEDTHTYAAVLYNMNAASPLYHRVILRAVDDHGREGWFIYRNAENPMTLEEVLAAISAEADKYTHVDTWESHYECPIHRLLSNEDYELQYG